MEMLKVSTTPIFPDIPRGQARKDFQVLVRVEAAAHPKARAPIDVVAVLDVSGSMNSPVASSVPEKRRTSRLDVLKSAAKFMVTKLDDGDRVSILAFNDRPVKERSSSGFLYMSGDGRRSAVKYVDQLQARGGTSLVPALEEAVKILDGRPGLDGRNRLGFIVLLTDGEDTASGFTWSDRHRVIIRSALSRYPVHSIGLGTAHDPEALLYMAQESQGSYSFVDDENMDKMAGALAICLGGLTTIVAANTRLVLAVEQQHNGVRIRRVDSGGHDSSSVSCGGGASCEVAVGVLYAGSAKHFVVHLDVPAMSPSPTVVDHQQRLLTVGYSYRSQHQVVQVQLAGEEDVFVERTPDVAVGCGRQQQLQALLPSPVVLQHMVRFELLEVVSSSLVRAETTMLKDVLQLKWEEFRASHQFWGGLDLSGLEDEVVAMVSRLRTTGAAAYVYAWVSSHQMQQATSMGSPETVVAEFLTPAMRLMLEEAHNIVPSTLHQAADTTTAAAGVSLGCSAAFEAMDRRLELWSKVKRDVQHLMFEHGDGGEEHLASFFHEASLDAIDRAMHRDIYLATVYTSKQRRCNSGAGERWQLD
ncbi:hypothetical protein U9M48_034745 [Paspalum notatum var. saurae]|uniref:VWFA domain-containing protein n=1 Tax=Paspalum notatum var. saurae TaxID=547442 RepID=A0AAQ3UAC4_PASNO